MRTTTPLWFFSPARRALDLAATGDEPSHIHIERPSRLLRQDGHAASSGEPTDQVLGDLDATDLTVQAA